MDEEIILHITRREDWERAIQNGAYTADSLESEGFIHCSTPEQVPGVANTLFKGVQGLVILRIDPERVTPEIRWEFSDGKIYPHIYGPLNLDAVVQVLPITANEGGGWEQDQI